MVGVRGDATIEAIRDYHVRVNGWSDIGYHYLVTKEGAVLAGRLPTKAGAHTAGANDTLGVCVAGDGDHEPWTQAQWRGVLALCVAKCQQHGWSEADVCGHREAPARLRATPTAKTCPGRLVDLDEVRAELALRLAEVRR
jgi:N-acetyl-anhydromuramyl-L-alanine amidase AmpD